MANEELDRAAYNKLTYMTDRIKEAYDHGPSGSWRKRWIPGVCKHSEIRCTHGDEIIGRRWRRRVCMICGRSLEGPIPELCFFTGEPHRR